MQYVLNEAEERQAEYRPDDGKKQPFAHFFPKHRRAASSAL
jgi:hypothetical protein